MYLKVKYKMILDNQNHHRFPFRQIIENWLYSGVPKLCITYSKRKKKKKISKTQIKIRKPEAAVETVGHKEGAGADKCFHFFFLRENMKF